MEIPTILVSFKDVDHPVRWILHKDPVCLFSGRKLKHPFKTRNVPVEIMRKGKPFTVVNLAYDEDFCTEEVKADMCADGTRFFVKFDGSCGQIQKGVARRRHDLKIDLKTGTFKEIAHPELDYEECQERPDTPEGEIPAGFHWPHMRNVTMKVKSMGDKWFAEAAETFMGTPWFEKHKDEVIMGEWMGPKIQGNKSDPLDVNTFIPFNMIEFVIPVEMRNPAGFQKFFAKIPNMEGLVAYCPRTGTAGGMGIYKIRRNMFINEFGRNMGWGRKTPAEMEIPKELKDVFEGVGARNFAEFLVKSVF